MVDELILATAQEVAARAETLAVACVEETGIGAVADKSQIRFASLEVAASLIGRPGIGVWARDSLQVCSRSPSRSGFSPG